MSEVYNLRERLPKWYRDDALVKALNAQVEEIKLDTYYKALCSYPIQPIQVWTTGYATSLEEVLGTMDNTNNVALNVATGTDTLGTTEGFALIGMGTTIASSLLQSYDGERSLKVTTTGSAIPEGVKCSVIAIADEKYVASFWVYAELNAELEAILTDKNAINVSVDITGVGAWQQISLEVDSMSVQPTLELQIVTRDDIQDTVFYIDNVRIVQDMEEISKVFNLGGDTTKEYNPTIEVRVPIGGETLDGVLEMKFYGCLEELIFSRELHRGDVLIISPDGTAIVNGVDMSEFLSGEYPIVIDNIEVIFEKPGALEPIEFIFRYGRTQEQKPTIRLMAHESYPLKQMDLFNSDGTKLLTKKYNKYDKITLDYTEYEEEALTQFYVEVQYHKLEGYISKGFPQSLTTTDEKYATNEMLDIVALQYGLTRRNYRIDIKPEEYANTYPPYYPYPVEQDYWFEIRLVEEYSTRNEAEDTLYLVDNSEDEIQVLSLTVKSPHLHDLIILTQQDSIEIKDFDRTGEIYTEMYTFSSILELVDRLEWESNLLTPNYITEGSGELSKTIYEFKNKGRYERFGLLKSEIYQYLGVIPEIKNISDYVMIWDKDEWNRKVWAGDEWDVGVFQVLIPYNEIPSNFEIMDVTELQQIVDKCKPIGTKGYPIYWHRTRVNCAFDVGEITREVEYEFILPRLTFTAANTDFLLELPAISFNVPKVYPEKDDAGSFLTPSTFGIVSTEAAEIIENFNQSYTSIPYDHINTGILKYESLGTGSTFSSDDFNDGNIDPIWTTIKNEANSTVVESGGKLAITVPTNVNGRWEGGSEHNGVIVHTSLPGAGDWEAVFELTVDGYLGTESSIGMTLFQDLNNAYNFGLVRGSNGQWQWSYPWFWVDRYINDVHVGQAEGSTNLDRDYLPIWLKIRKESTTYYFLYSHNGVDFETLYSTSSLPITPTKIGIYARKWATNSTAWAKIVVNNFVLTESPTVYKYLGIDQNVYATELILRDAYWENNDRGWLAWRNFIGLWGSGSAVAGGEGSGWLETDYLVCDFDASGLPDDAIITAMDVGQSTYYNQSTPPNAIIHLSHELQIGSRPWTQQWHVQDGYQGWHEHWRTFGLWGYDAPVTAAELKQKARFKFWTGGIGQLPGAYVGVDWVTFRIFFRRTSAELITDTAIATPPSVPATPTPLRIGKWDKLTETLQGSPDTNTDISYSVFKEIPDQQQITNNANYAFGTNAQREVAQSFIPTNSKLTGIKIKAGTTAKTGSPTSFYYQLRTDNNGTPSAAVLQAGTIPATDWTNSAVIELNFNITTLTPGTRYWLVLGVSPADNNNYFWIRYTTPSAYASGRMLYSSGTTWYTVSADNADLYFITLKPSTNLITGFDAPVPLSNIEYVDIKVKAELQTAVSTPLNTPRLTNLKIDRKEVIQ